MIQTGRLSQFLRKKPWVVLNQNRQVQSKGGRYNGNVGQGFSLSYISYAQNASQGEYEMAISLVLVAFSGAIY